VSSGDLLADLEAGRRRAVWPDSAAPNGWRIDPDVKEAILGLFRQPDTRDLELGGVLRFRDRASLPTRASLDGVRVVPGGTSIRAGAFLGPEVVVMPPSFVNIGAFIGAGTMVDSHVLVGSCAQVGERVHLAAGVQIGGVLEPPGARPVIVEDECFIGAGCGLFEGVLVQRGAVLAAGVVLTGASRLYDPAGECILSGTAEAPLVVPAGAVVVPGTRALAGAFAAEHGLGIATSVIAKRRDAQTDARVALEEALR
jgi:2,3,4,5-tetrahydropyridine-2-carboxylate N-succinyltransferase